MFLYNSGVVNVLRRLGAHQAVAVATISRKDNIVWRVNPIKAPNISFGEVELQHIPILDVLHVSGRVNHSSRGGP
jgi:hypothetical protein